MSLETIEEIERAIATLAPRQIEDLYAWLDRNFPPALDSRITSDVAAGRLDNAIFRALEDEANNRVRPL